MIDELYETTTIYHPEILRLTLEKAKDIGLTVSVSQECRILLS